MTLDRFTPVNAIDIWQPRWKDRTVLIAKFKVATHNSITFSKTKTMPGEYYLSGEEIRKHPINNNGKLDCYVVPMDKLEKLERV